METKVNMVEDDRGSNGGQVQYDRGNNVAIERASKQADQKIEDGEQLLPGIPNEITINLIAPKLPWTAFHILSSVSHAWLRAIQSGQVYAARVRSKSTQTLFAIYDRPWDDVNTIALFSLEDGSWYHLPPIPGVENGIPWSCQCVSSDGKLYVLGGTEYEDEGLGQAEVYVFDLAGQREWERCARMENARDQFACGVKNGKIYAFGGSSEGRPVCGSEVYDPKEDAWSPITPVPSFRFGHTVTTVGEEFFLHGGEFYDSDFIEWTLARGIDPNESDDDDPVKDHIKLAFNTEIYDPLKDRWRIVERSSKNFRGHVGVKGKLHKLSSLGFEVYDSHTDSWKPPQLFSFVGHTPSDYFTIKPFSAVAVDEEVLALVDLREDFGEYNLDVDGMCLIRSQGLGDENKETMWQEIQCSLFLGHDSEICPLSFERIHGTNCHCSLNSSVLQIRSGHA